MGLLWNPYSLPELKQLPRNQRKEIWRTAWKKSSGEWRLVLAGLLIGASPWLFIFLVEHYPLAKFLRFMAVMIVYLTAVAIHQHWAISFLRARIWELIPGLCPACGYDMR